MADGAEKYRIPLFDGTNFDNWKFRMKVLLTELELIDYTIAPNTSKVIFTEEDTASQKTVKTKELEDHAKTDRKCRNQLIQRIADSQLEYVKDTKTSFDLWSVLTGAFQSKSITSQLSYRKKLLLLKFDAQKDTLTNHFFTFDKLVRELRGTGATVEENDSVCMLLLSMPKEFNNVVTAIETVSAENLTLGFVKSRLIDEETKRASVSKKEMVTDLPAAFSTHINTKGKNNKKGGDSKFPFKCYRCHKFGHKKSDCPDGKDTGTSSGVKSSANVATREDLDDEYQYAFSITNDNNNNNGSEWCLDSGASEHLATSNTVLENIERLEKPV